MAPRSNFIVRGGADFSKLNKALNQTQAKLTTFQAAASKSMKLISAALGSIAVGKLIKDSTKMAMAVESATDNINRNMGSSAKAFQMFADNQSKALGMARKDAYGYGSTFSNLLGSFMEDTQAVASETESLMRAAAIISSKTGRTFDDTANRIRSGMLGSTEAIEDIGIYTQVSMLESTEAFKKFANGKSWAQLDFKVQQQIRLAAILEQAYDRYGDTLADTTQTKQAKFIASLENIRLNLGNTFLPIYNTVLPALTALAGKLEAITAHLAAFSVTVFGKAKSIQVIEDQTEAIAEQGDAIEEAGKQAKKSIAPFDEIIQIAGGAGAAASAGAAGGSGVKLEPVTTEASDSTGIFNSTIDKLKESLQPTIDALGRFKDALEPIGKFAFNNIKSFYNDSLKPIGEWVLGQGLPRLLDVGSGLLNSINWSKLSDAMVKLNKSLTPFALAVGEGLISFIETMGDILKPILATTSDLLAKGIDAIAKAISKIPEETAIAIGGAIGGIATSLLLFSGATAIAGIISDIKKAFTGFLTAINKHPLIAIGVAIGAIAGALIAASKAKFNESELGKFTQYLDELNQRVATNKDKVDELLVSQAERKKAIEDEYGAIQILADKYLNLSEKENMSVGEKELLKSYAQELIKLIPELTPLIDAETGAYKGTKEELTDLIKRTKEYYLVQAAKEDLIELAKQLYTNEKLLAEQQAARDEIEKRLTEKEKEHKKAVEELNKQVNNSSDEYTYNANAVAGVSKEVAILKEELKKANKNIEITEGNQRNLNSKFADGEKYIADYSSAAKTEMPKIEAAVKTAYSNIEKEVKNFKLPNLHTKLVVDTSELGNMTSGYANTMKIAGPYITQYASGGLPDTGELFIANEAGPELIGRIGNQTAVANTDQIVDGIARGVSTANAEEVALLKQQNSLLQAILQKTGITTKSIYDAVVTENNSRAKRGASPLFA